MRVKELKKILENVDPELEVFVWNNVEKIYEEATFADVEELFKLDCGERVYNEETDDYEMLNCFVISL